MPFFPIRDDNPSHRLPVVTLGIIGVNVVMLVWLARLPPLQQQLVVYERGFVPARIGAMLRGQALDVKIGQTFRHPRFGVPLQVVRTYELGASPRRVFASLLTTMFLHAGWQHLVGNMWFLLIFGNNVEDRLGHIAYLGFYLLGGLLATAGHWVQDPASMTPVVGASGAVAAVLGAYAVTWPWARIHTLLLLGCIPLFLDFPSLVVLGVWFVVQLLSARAAIGVEMTGGVAFLAHACGFVAGAVLMPLACRLIPDHSPRPAPRWDDDDDDDEPSYIDEDVWDRRPYP
ncbi:MAG: rhomboid family intramembrane serine protease [Pirellulales bacterium]|nr:rhomboid family intramembrane serine protease [Pirellulales bacterium]